MTEQNMKATERALRLKRRLKKGKPSFVRPESWRYVRLKESWRRPRGLDHKVRLKYDGWPPGAGVGYRGPRVTRGLHPSGLKEILVYSVDELREIDPKTQVVRIAHTVGRRNRTKILAEARKKKITILNFREAKEASAKEKEPPEEGSEEEKAAGEGIEEPEGERVKAKRRRKETKEK